MHFSVQWFSGGGGGGGGWVGKPLIAPSDRDSRKRWPMGIWRYS